MLIIRWLLHVFPNKHKAITAIIVSLENFDFDCHLSPQKSLFKDGRELVSCSVWTYGGMNFNPATYKLPSDNTAIHKPHHEIKWVIHGFIQLFNNNKKVIPKNVVKLSLMHRSMKNGITIFQHSHTCNIPVRKAKTKHKYRNLSCKLTKMFAENSFFMNGFIFNLIL